MGRGVRWMLAAAAALLTWTGAAHAQIVNVQPMAGSASGEGLYGELQGSVNWRTGNVDLLLGKASLLASYKSGMHRIISSSTFEMGVQSGADFADQKFSHLRYQVAFTDSFTWEVFGQAASDAFRRMELRALGGTGPRLSLVDGPAVSLAMGLAYMFEHEALAATELASAAGGTVLVASTTTDVHRASTYLTAKFVIDPLVALHHTTYYQPRLDDFAGDFRVLSQTSLSIQLAERLALVVAYEVAYDSDAPEGVDGTDSRTNVKVAIGF